MLSEMAHFHKAQGKSKINVFFIPSIFLKRWFYFLWNCIACLTSDWAEKPGHVSFINSVKFLHKSAAINRCHQAESGGSFDVENPCCIVLAQRVCCLPRQTTDLAQERNKAPALKKGQEVHSLHVRQLSQWHHLSRVGQSTGPRDSLSLKMMSGLFKKWR